MQQHPVEVSGKETWVKYQQCLFLEEIKSHYIQEFVKVIHTNSNTEARIKSKIMFTRCNISTIVH
jgi:hypothetical protein